MAHYAQTILAIAQEEKKLVWQQVDAIWIDFILLIFKVPSLGGHAVQAVVNQFKPFPQQEIADYHAGKSKSFCNFFKSVKFLVITVPFGGIDMEEVLLGFSADQDERIQAQSD